MATRCCDHHISCPGAGNLDFDTPFANLSAEAPDIDFYIGINWGWDRNVPRLDSWWTRNSCLGVCESVVSQADADACAARNQLICMNGDWKPPPVDPVTDGVPFNGPRTPRRLDLFPNNPETCIASCPDGIGFAFTTPAGKYISPSQILSDRMALSEACRFAIFAKICLSSLSPSEVCTGKQYLAVIHATGGTAPMSFSVVAGTVAPGIVLSQGPGDHDLTLAGIPTAGGAYQFTIRCEDAVGHFMQKTFTLGVAGIDQATVPDGKVGTAYADTLSASNLTLPFTWTVDSGSLPAGLSLNSASGAIFGTPTTAGSATFTVRVTDGLGVSCTRAYSLTVAPSFAPLGWWTWNGGVTLPFNDSVAAQPFTDDLNSPAHYAFVAGKINQTIELTPAAGFSYNPTQRPSTTSMAKIRDGFTCTVWMRPNNYGGNDFFGVDIFAINGVFTIPPYPPRVYTLVCQYENNPGQFHLTATDAGFITVIDLTVPMALVLGTWYFITFGWDKATGRMFFSINNGALSFSAGSDPLADPFTTARVSIQGQNFSTVQNIDWDEINVWPGTLTAAQISNLYNSGNGRTYTDLFP